MGIDATQISGATTFAIVSAACWGAARRRPHQPCARIWTVLAVLLMVLAADVVWGGPHQVHNLVSQWLQQSGQYAQRQTLQAALLGAGLLVFGLALWGTLQATKGCAQPVRWAALCALGLLGVFCVELISLHGIDAVMYRQLGPLKVVGWLWLLWALPVGWMARRR